MVSTPNSLSTVVLVLANEKSRRSTKYKAVMPLKGGTMLDFTTTLGINLNVGPVLVILGKNLSKPGYLDSKKLTWLKDVSADQNHYTGIATALFDLQKRNNLPARILVITCTHPYLTIGHLNKLLARDSQTAKKDMVLSEYGKDVHLPAVIGKRVFSEFHLDKKEKDLAEILHAQNYQTDSVMLPNGTIDIDSREDYLNRMGD